MTDILYLFDFNKNHHGNIHYDIKVRFYFNAAKCILLNSNVQHQQKFCFPCQTCMHHFIPFMTKSGYINMFATCHMSLFVTDYYSNHTVL